MRIQAGDAGVMYKEGELDGFRRMDASTQRAQAQTHGAQLANPSWGGTHEWAQLVDVFDNAARTSKHNMQSGDAGVSKDDENPYNSLVKQIQELPPQLGGSHTQAQLAAAAATMETHRQGLGKKSCDPYIHQAKASHRALATCMYGKAPQENLESVRSPGIGSRLLVEGAQKFFCLKQPTNGTHVWETCG